MTPSVAVIGTGFGGLAATIELSPGSEGRRIPENWTVPIQNTLPDVKFEEILSSLDRDTRDYLRLLIEGGGKGLKGRGGDLREVLRRFEPTYRDLGLVSTEKEAIRIIHEAVDAGLTFMDNAWEYHDGKGEERMGKALDGRRDRVFLMTKVCTHGRDAKVAMRQPST